MLLTIIIPTKNSSKWLGGLLKQLEEISERVQFVFVDDCSIDNTSEMILSWIGTLKSWNDHTLINGAQHAGVSACRNAALEKAKGKYIWFIDSDDRINLPVVKKILMMIAQDGHDLYILNWKLVNSYSECNGEEPDNLKFVNNNLNQLDLLMSRSVESYLWAFIANKKLFNDILFPTGRLFEDYAVTHKIFKRSNKPVLINEDAYFYVKRENSLINSMNDKQRISKSEDIIHISNEILNYYRGTEYEKNRKHMFFLIIYLL